MSGIRFCAGDLFGSGADALVNPVNTAGVMGAGLAEAFARRFPAIVPPYRAACREGRLRVGTVLALEVHAPPARFVVNLPTKRHWAHPAQLADVEAGIGALRQWVAAAPVRRVAVPALGCGLGGLPWDLVRPALAEGLHGLAAEILVFEPVPVAAARQRRGGATNAGKLSS